MLELRHSPWCEGLDCVDSLEEPLADSLEGDPDLVGAQLEGSSPQEDTISSSLQLVLPSDFAPSRVNSKLTGPRCQMITVQNCYRHCGAYAAAGPYPVLE